MKLQNLMVENQNCQLVQQKFENGYLQNPDLQSYSSNKIKIFSIHGQQAIVN